MSRPQIQADCPLPKVTQPVRERATPPSDIQPWAQARWVGPAAHGAPRRTKQGNGGGFVRTKARDAGWEWCRAGFPKEAVGGDRT